MLQHRKRCLLMMCRLRTLIFPNCIATLNPAHALLDTGKVIHNVVELARVFREEIEPFDQRSVLNFCRHFDWTPHGFPDVRFGF